MAVIERCPGCGKHAKHTQVCIRPVDGRTWHVTCYEVEGRRAAQRPITGGMET
jgi:hypothetical protein